MAANRIDLVIGAQIRRQRNALGISISALSASIGASEFEITQFENGKKRISAAALLRICKLFNVGAACFFDAFDLDLQDQTGS